MKSYRYMDPNAMDAQYGTPKQDAVGKGLGMASDATQMGQTASAPREQLVSQGASAAGVSPEGQQGLEAAQKTSDAAASGGGITGADVSGYLGSATQAAGGIHGLASGGGTGSKRRAQEQLTQGAESAVGTAASTNPYTAAAYYGGQALSSLFTGDSLGKNIGKLF